MLELKLNLNFALLLVKGMIFICQYVTISTKVVASIQPRVKWSVEMYERDFSGLHDWAWVVVGCAMFLTFGEGHKHMSSIDVVYIKP